MTARLLLVAFLAAAPLVAQTPSTVDLTKARKAHRDELDRLRQKLLDDIDAVIRKEDAAGVPIDYLKDERKAFAEGGVLPILPKLRPVAGAYEVAKAKADEALAAALERAGKREEARALRPPEPKAEPPTAPGKSLETKEDLRHALTAFFVDGRDIGNINVLTELAGEVGLDAAEFAEALRARTYREAHRAALHHAYEEAGVTGVPMFVIGRRVLTGLQDQEMLAAVIDQELAAGRGG